MIKIPEFWYVDDYALDTKTHNLKICPHAKPGWYHHKEAYVSAYEAFNFGNAGRLVSMKVLFLLSILTELMVELGLELMDLTEKLNGIFIHMKNIELYVICS